MVRNRAKIKATTSKSKTQSAESLFEFLEDLVPQLARAIGPLCEVVLHQNTSRPPTIRAIGNGHVTNRSVGDLMTQILVNGDDDTNRSSPLFNYVSTMPDRRHIRVSVIPIRHSGEIIGYFAVNFLVHDLEQAIQALSILTRPEPHAETIVENFISPRQVISQTAAEYLRSKGRTIAMLSKNERIDIVSHLKSRGVFRMRGAVEEVASLLQISRTAVYNYLSVSDRKRS